MHLTSRPGVRNRVRSFRGRRGSTFVAVLAMMAVMITLATVIAPSVVGVLEFQRVDQAAQRLRVYERAIANFHLHVSARPNALRQLTRQVVATDRNSCNGTYNNLQLKDDGSVWRGPYLTRVAPSHGELPLDIGVVKDTLVRTPAVAANPNDPGELAIRVQQVQEAEARALDRRVDGTTVTPTTGKVRWGAVDSVGFVTVSYTLTVTGC